MVEEFTHACSAIRMRLSARKNWEQRKRWMANVSYGCELSIKDSMAIYKHTPGLWSGNDKLLSCFQKAISTLQDKESSNYCNEMCPIVQVEEATAAYTMWKLDVKNRKVMPEVFPNSCFGIITSSHPPSWEILSCALAHDPEINVALMETLQCY